MKNNLDIVKKLREETNVSVMACKKALERAEGDFSRALAFLKRESAGIADKKSDRRTSSGLVASYIHLGGKIGVLAEVRCETDFVARNDAFKEFAGNIAMHIAAMDPHFLSLDQAPLEIKKEMREIFEKEAAETGKPAEIKEKIVNGKLETYLKEKSLYSQFYVKNQDITVEEYIKETIQKFGENIVVSRFARFVV
ncbi:MAG: elongation factor Ts [Candidatus Niyogibacteria bacterium]|nr:elongation factor Ts [Candidatus Niyogibacteria bacterium]